MTSTIRVSPRLTAALRSLLAITSALVITGCASMSEEECLTADWYTIGYEDGSRGYTADQIGNRRQACAKHGVAPDFRVYQDGRAEGLKEYCQPQRGFNVGASGGRYYGVCPANLEPGFVDAFRTGSQLHALRSNVNAANHSISAKEAELEDIRETIRRKEAVLIGAETSIEDRVLAISDLKELNERTGQLEAEILDLVEERAHHERQLLEYEQVLADSGY